MIENTDKLLLHYFTRQCETIPNLIAGDCTTITQDIVPLQGDTTAPETRPCTACSRSHFATISPRTESASEVLPSC